MSLDKWRLNSEKSVAVSTVAYWLPIDENTPRNVKVLAINREQPGIAIQAEIRNDNQWFSHGHPLPKFKD
jgi:hypothetical protein